MIDFIQFVNDQTVIVSDPIFFKEAVEQYVEKKPKNRMGSLSLVNDKWQKLEKRDTFVEVTLKERIKFLANW